MQEDPGARMLRVAVVIQLNFSGDRSPAAFAPTPR